MSSENRTKKKATEVPVERVADDQMAQETAEESLEETPDLETQLAKVQAQASDYLDGWQRARAELDNYRKRITRERTEWEDNIKRDVILSLLPALDDFDLALANLPEDIREHDWVSGLVLVHRKLRTELEALGLTEIEATGQSFDPVLHEAITNEKSETHASGEIIGVTRKGYRLGNKVIRPAMVRVAS